MGLLERVAEQRSAHSERAFPVDQWLADYLVPAFNQQMGQFSYGNTIYPFGLNQTLTGTQAREIAPSLMAYAGALRRCPPAYAAQMVRAMVLSQARFVFRNRPSSATPRRLFGTRELSLLEQPWTNATTGQMLALMEWHAGMVGNAYVARQASRLRVLRPDWTMIVYGSQREPDDPAFALDGDVIGYAYQNRGLTGGYPGEVEILLPQDVAHWSPVPDPLSPGLGMSWLTPAMREIQGDVAVTEHKLRYFANGATPNLVVRGLAAATQQAFDALVEKLEEKHAGVANAYRTLYLTAGADATVIGSNLQEADLKTIQGSGETRIAALSRVPASILQISEGLAGSSLNAGNFGMARRIWADTWIYPTLQDLAHCLAKLINVPVDAELWTDTGDMPILREDAKDAALITQILAATINALVIEGWTPESAKAAVIGQDMTLLKHTGLVSVQLQPPGSALPGAPNGTAPKPPKPSTVPGPPSGRQARGYPTEES